MLIDFTLLFKSETLSLSWLGRSFFLECFSLKLVVLLFVILLVIVCCLLVTHIVLGLLKLREFNGDTFLRIPSTKTKNTQEYKATTNLNYTSSVGQETYMRVQGHKKSSSSSVGQKKATREWVSYSFGRPRTLLFLWPTELIR